MTTSLFPVLIFLPSIALCYVVLHTFYGPVRAYLAISWVPAALLAVLWGFHELEVFGEPLWNLAPLASALGWASLVQALFGVGLLVWAVARREPWPALAVAVVITALPFLATLV